MLQECNPKQIISAGQPTKSKNKRAKSFQIIITHTKCDVPRPVPHVFRALTERQALEYGKDKARKLSESTGFQHTIQEVREIKCTNCV